MAAHPLLTAAQTAPSLLDGLGVHGLPAPAVVATYAAAAGLLLGGPALLRRALLGSPGDPADSGAAPGGLARRRAANGVDPDEQGWPVGYASWHSLARIDWPQLRLGGVILGAPGSGKTTAVEGLARAARAARAGMVLVDPKASPSLRRTVEELGGTVWTIGGELLFDPLEADAEVLADQLLEGEPEDRNAPRVFRGGARLAVQQLGRALAAAGETPDLRRVVDMLRRGDWQKFVRDTLGPEYVPLTEVERDGVKTFAAGLAGLMLSPAGRSLGAGPGAVRLGEALEMGQLVLFSLDANLYPDTARRIGGWVFLGLKAQIGRRLQRPGKPCVIAVDEAHKLGWTGRLAVDLLATGREAGLPVVLSTQGPSDLANLGQHLLERVAQDAAWILAFRQGPLDSATTARMLGVRAATETSRRSDGVQTTRSVEATGQALAAVGERISVPPSVLENLETGNAWLRVPPAHGARGQLALVRVLLPRRGQAALPRPAVPVLEAVRAVPVTNGSSARTARTVLSNDELWARLPRHVQARIERKGVDECWPGKGKPHPNGYLRVSIDNHDEWMSNYVYTTCIGPLAEDESVEHVCHTRALQAGTCRGGAECAHKRCQNWHHFIALFKPDNTRRRWWRPDRQGGAAEEPESDDKQDETLNEAAADVVEPDSETIATTPATTFTIALFAGIDKPAVESRTVSLDELRQLLTRFEILKDKRRGRCWSPTRYIDAATTRANDGVAEVSALVFDMDKIPPDAELLADVYWLGHTTWSHTPTAPRWRVVMPLTAPVPAAQWRDVWQRARAALCPEADPSCKDASRQYYLPSHRGGVTARATCHAGPMLDASTLPALPPEPNRPELRRSPSALHPRAARDADHRRGEVYMGGVIAKLAGVPPGGRNSALNGAAWTLGRWVAAGALDQGLAEDELYAAAERNGLVSDDGERACWATIRSGLGAGLQDPKDLDEDQDERKPGRRRRV